MKKYIFLVFAYWVCTHITFSQQKNYTLSSAVNVSSTYVARDFVHLKPGFSFSAQNDKSFSARINEHLQFATDYASMDNLPDPETGPNASYMVGTIAGESNVSPTGAAVYQIPITIPQGTNNVQPNVSIVYNSQSNNGLLGYGWHLQAHSAICRTGSTLYHDNKSAAPTLTTSDNLLLDGQRLLKVSGSNLASGSTYATELETYSIITYKTINSKLCFEVKTRDGITMEYGSTDDSFIEAAGTSTAYCWLLSKVTDINGNYIKYTYTKNTSTKEFSLQQIEYTGNSINNTAPANKIEFLYDTRSDVEETYFAGKKITQSLILKRIKTYIKGVVINEYKLNYCNDGFYSKLIEVEEYGQGGSRYNSTIIDRGDYDSQEVGQNWKEQQLNLNTPLKGLFPIVADFTGNGKTDILSVPNLPADNISVDLHICSTFPNYTKVSTTKFSGTVQNIGIGDLNADGITDLIIVTKVNGKYNYSYYYGSSAGTFTQSKVNAFSVSTSSNNDVMIVADFNGDGRDDILVKGNQELYSGTGTLLGSGGIDNWGVDLSPEYPNNRHLVDFDGDGKMELLMVNASRSWVYTFNGSTFVRVPSFDNTNLKNSTILFFGDFNGDGKTDILSGHVGKSFLYFSTGSSFIEKEIPLIADGKMFVGQNNKDGKTDVYYSKIPVYYGDKLELRKAVFDGTNFIVEKHICSTISLNSYWAGKNYFVSDFDGDGRSDFLWVGGISNLHVVNHLDEQNLFVRKIRNGLGQITEFQYSTTANVDTYSTSPTSPSFPIARASFALTTVSSMEKKADNIYEKQEYTYKDLYAHRQGKGLLGFGEITITDNTKSIKTINTYGYNTSYFNTFLEKQEIKTSSNNSISTTEYTPSYIYVNTKRIFPYYSKIIQTDHLTGVVTTTTNSNLDYGIPKTVSVKYGNDLTETTTKYLKSITTGGKRILGLPDSILITKTYNNKTWKDKSTFAYNSNYLLQKQTDYTNSTIKIGEESYLYDIFGNITQKTIKPFSSSETLITKYGYTPDGRFIENAENPMGLKTTYAYNEKGQCEYIKDHYGNYTNYKYDALGRNNKIIYPDQTIKTITTTWNSSLTGSLYCIIESRTGQPIIKTYYDAASREIRQSVVRVDGTEVHTDKKYDEKGRLEKVSLPFTGSSASLWNTYNYDSYHRITALNNASGKSVDYAYSGNAITETNNGISISRTKNAAGWMTKAVDHGGTINYYYRPDGQPDSIRIADGPKTSFNYDDYGRKNKLTDPSAGTITYDYDDYGNVNKEINAKGQITSSIYNKFGQMTSKTSSEMNTSYNYTYDRLDSEINVNGTKTYYNYDNLNRLTSVKEHATANDWFQKDYSYDSGNITSINYSSNLGNLGTENYEYSNGHLKRTKFNNSTVIWEINSVNEFLQPTNVKTGSITRVYNYDSYGMPTGRTATSSSNGTFQNHTYSFDIPTGNLDYRKDNKRNIREDFGYDELNRLTEFGNNSMEYDDLGNITSKSNVGSFDYYPDKPYAIEYLTPTGNAVPIRQQAVAYTTFHRPETITENGYQATFLYNTNHERVRMQMKQNSAVQYTRYYLGGQYEKDIPNTGNIKEKLYLGGDYYSAFAVYQKENGTGSLYYLHRDYLGSITNITNSSGTQVEEYSYDAWGRMRNPVTQIAYNPGSEPTLLFGRGYTGHEHLAVFGLINMNARLYDAALGRFLSPDPYVQMPDFTQNFNRYSYGLNNPMVYTDPDGEFIHLIIGAVIGGVANWAFNGAEFSWKGLGYLGVGAAAGALGAGIGAGISSMLPIAGTASGGFAAGFLGTSAATTATSSFVSGALIGGGAGFASGFTSGLGNGLLDNQSLGQALWSGTKSGLIGGLSGTAVGGLWSGVDAVRDGRRFWDGATVSKTVLVYQDVSIVGQVGDNNCAPASAESIDKSFGGNMSQEQIRNLPNLGGDPNTVPLGDKTTWDAYAKAAGRTYNGATMERISPETLYSVLSSDSRLAINLIPTNGGVGHSIVGQNLSVEKITKISGKVIRKYILTVMNPANGGYYQQMNMNKLTGNFFVIHPF